MIHPQIALDSRHPVRQQLELLVWSSEVSSLAKTPS